MQTEYLRRTNRETEIATLAAVLADDPYVPLVKDDGYWAGLLTDTPPESIDPEPEYPWWEGEID